MICLFSQMCQPIYCAAVYGMERNYDRKILVLEYELFISDMIIHFTECF